jgi:hypothetical protein
MPIISRRATAFVLAAALSLGLSQAAVAQAPGQGPILIETTAIYRAMEPVKAPAPKPETKGRAPSADAIRIPGFWDLQGDPATAPRGGWVWVPGRWIAPPFPGARWDLAHWGWHDGWWSWVPGHWDERRQSA